MFQHPPSPLLFFQVFLPSHTPNFILHGTRSSVRVHLSHSFLDALSGDWERDTAGLSLQRNKGERGKIKEDWKWETEQASSSPLPVLHPRAPQRGINSWRNIQKEKIRPKDQMWRPWIEAVSQMEKARRKWETRNCQAQRKGNEKDRWSLKKKKIDNKWVSDKFNFLGLGELCLSSY